MLHAQDFLQGHVDDMTETCLDHVRLSEIQTPIVTKSEESVYRKVLPSVLS